MSEEKTQPEEAKPEPAQTGTKERIEIMITALKLSEIATGYKDQVGSNSAKIFIEQGREIKNDPTLYLYIKKAEKTIIKRYEQEIIEEAGSLIKSELDVVRELLK